MDSVSSSEVSDSEAHQSALPGVSPVVTNSKRFTGTQKATLNSYYRAGMKGVGARHMPSMRCAYEVDCSVEKVKVSIYKRAFTYF